MRGPKLSVRGKIMGTIVAVSVMVLALGAWAAFDAVTSTGGRGGPVLQKHYERYKSNLQSLGTNDYAISRVIASDPALGQALDGGEAALVGDTIKRLMEPLQSTVAPDLVVISDASGNTHPVGGIKTLPGAEYRATRLYSDLREGKPVRGKLALINGKAYRVAGALSLIHISEPTRPY